MTNIMILTGGEPPKRTGNDKKDLEAVMQYLERLMRALEITFEQIGGKL